MRQFNKKIKFVYEVGVGDEKTKYLYNYTYTLVK